MAILLHRRPAEQRRDNAGRNLERAENVYSRAIEAAAKATTLFEAARCEWRAWLEKAELPDTLTPEHVANLLNRLDAAREQLKAIDSDRDRIGQMQTSMRQYTEHLQAVAVGSGCDTGGKVDAEATIGQLVTRLQEHDDQADAIEDASKVLADVAKRLSQSKLKSEMAQRLHQQSVDAELGCQQQWKDLLQRLGLRDSLAVETASSMFQAIERARDQLVPLNELRKRESTERQLLRSFCDDVRSISQATGRSAPVDADVPQMVSVLSRELDQAEASQRETERLRERLREYETHTKLLDRQIFQRQQEIQHLFDAAGADDEESFRRNAAYSESRQSLEEQIRHLESRLRQLAGDGDAVQTMKDELARSTPEELDSERIDLETTIETLESDQQVAAAECGRSREQLDRLETSDELSRLRIEQQTVRAELDAEAEEWSILTIATYLMDRAREKYEHERRPGVLKEAERYLARITNRKYTEILAPAGEEQVVVLTPNGS
jgi:uncharacterized protein YhaN